MATWTRRTVRSAREEWVVPTGPWGAPWQEIASAVSHAWALYREHHGLPEDAPQPGDFVRFTTRDDEIVVSFTTEEPR